MWHAPVDIALNESRANSSAAETFLVRGALAVPEPAILGVLGLGLAAMGLMRRRRQG